MRIAIFITVLLFISASLKSQKSCKFEKNEMDAVTEFQIKITEPVQICRVNNSPFLIKAQAIGPHKYLKIRYYRYNNFAIIPNSNLIFTFTDNTTLELIPRPAPADTAQVDESFAVISSMIIFPLSEPQFYKLLNFPITQVKYYITGGYEIKEIKEGRQADIKKILSCIED